MADQHGNVHDCCEQVQELKADLAKATLLARCDFAVELNGSLQATINERKQHFNLRTGKPLNGEEIEMRDAFVRALESLQSAIQGAAIRKST